MRATSAGNLAGAFIITPKSLLLRPTDEKRNPLLRVFLTVCRPGGEIGRRARFRCECRKAWGFESLLGHISAALRHNTGGLFKALCQN